MTRPGRVEVYRTTRNHTVWADCPVYEPDECDLATHTPNGQHLVSLRVPAWRWRRYAANGAIIGGSTEAYVRLRDLAHNLEQNLDGYKLLDQNGCLTGPDWFLWGLEANWQDDGGSAYLTLPPGLTLGMGMRGVRIPVKVPAGIWLGSRR